MAAACRFGVDTDGLFGGGAAGDAATNPSDSSPDTTPPTDGGSGADGAAVVCSVKPCAVAVTAGGVASCAAFDDGKVRCWGDNSNGAVGGAQPSKYFTPIEVPLSGPAKTIATRQWGWPNNRTEGVTCAVHAGGVSCWGVNRHGVLGRGFLDAGGPVLPGLVVGLPEADEIAVMGGEAVCARTKGAVSCWGSRLTSADAGDTATPEPLNLPAAAESVVGGRAFVCALLATKDVVCVGYPDDWKGPDGIDGGNQRVGPATVVQGLSGASQITVGNNHVCALVGGRVICVGRNDDGQLGRGGLAAKMPEVPGDVKGLPAAAKSIAAGAGHTCAVLVDDTIWCWGRNKGAGKVRGQLGTPGVPYTMIPLRVVDAPAGPIVAVRAGYAHTCALTMSGAVYCWGANDYGQLGYDSSPDEPNPRPKRVAF